MSNHLVKQAYMEMPCAWIKVPTVYNVYDLVRGEFELTIGETLFCAASSLFTYPHVQLLHLTFHSAKSFRSLEFFCFVALDEARQSLTQFI